MFLLLFSPILGTDIVYAQTETPTVTPTFEPLFPTSTTIPTLNLSCPVGAPIGLGTVTPNANWDYYCKNCLKTLTPAAPMPTLGLAVSCEDYYGPGNVPAYCHNSDPVTGQGNCVCDQNPTAQPTPTITATPDTTVKYWVKWFLPMETFGGWVNTGAWTIFYSQPITGLHLDNNVIKGLIVEGSKTSGGNYRFYGSGYQNPNTDMVSWSGSWEDYSYYSATNIYNRCIDFANSGACAAAGRTDNGDFQNANINGDKFGLAIQTYGGESISFSWNALGVIYYGVEEVIQQPTPTPGSGYCNTVDGTTGGLELNSIWSLPVITQGAASCMELFGWNIPLATKLSQYILEWVGITVPDSLYIPAINLCVRPILFGSLSIFGLAIDLDILSMAMSLVLILRIVLRS